MQKTVQKKQTRSYSVQKSRFRFEALTLLQAGLFAKSLFVCLFVCAYDSRYACGGTATAETTFLGRDPEYTRVTAEETRCRIAY